VFELALKELKLSPRGVGRLVRRPAAPPCLGSLGLRLLKAHDLITSPGVILMKAVDTFAHPTAAPSQLWQTYFTYLRVIGCGWSYLSLCSITSRATLNCGVAFTRLERPAIQQSVQQEPLPTVDSIPNQPHFFARTANARSVGDFKGSLERADLSFELL